MGIYAKLMLLLLCFEGADGQQDTLKPMIELLNSTHR